MNHSSGYEWARVNDTELYQLCLSANLSVVPSMPRPKLIALLEGLEEEVPMYNTINDWRDAIMLFVNEYWSKLQSQVTCPAKSQDPRACYGCIDQQVLACVVKNESAVHLIQIRRKNA